MCSVCVWGQIADSGDTATRPRNPGSTYYLAISPTIVENKVVSSGSLSFLAKKNFCEPKFFDGPNTFSSKNQQCIKIGNFL